MTAESSSLEKLYAAWPAPQHIVAFTTCRGGGHSRSPYDSLNLAEHVGDATEAVAANRQMLAGSCEGLQTIQWLNQVHGSCVVNAPVAGIPDADACFTQQSGVGCAVMTADCLPLLLCDDAGCQVAAVHAGWRGLVDGVIERAVAAFHCDASHLLVWLGPAISRQHFEVGPEVRQAFIDSTPSVNKRALTTAFTASDKDNHYFADLYQMARIRLQSCGVRQIYGGGHCCYSQAGAFYSYRRDKVTGRMVSLIYKRSL